MTDHIEDVCQRLADADWLAVAPHLFHRTGDPVLDHTDYEGVRPHMAALTADGIATDVDAALDYIDGAGFRPEVAGIVGFCMGGSVALATAVRRQLGAAVTFYGGGVTQGRFGYPPLLELAPELRTPWLGLFGDRDQSIPVEDVEALAGAAAEGVRGDGGGALPGSGARVPSGRQRCLPRRVRGRCLAAHARLVRPLPEYRNGRHRLTGESGACRHAAAPCGNMCSWRERPRSCTPTSTPSMRRSSSATIPACAGVRSSSAGASCSPPATRPRRSGSAPPWAAPRPGGCAPGQPSCSRACRRTQRPARRCSRCSTRRPRWSRACRSTRRSSTSVGCGASPARLAR